MNLWLPFRHPHGTLYFCAGGRVAAVEVDAPAEHAPPWWEPGAKGAVIFHWPSGAERVFFAPDEWPAIKATIGLCDQLTAPVEVMQ